MRAETSAPLSAFLTTNADGDVFDAEFGVHRRLPGDTENQIPKTMPVEQYLRRYGVSDYLRRDALDTKHVRGARPQDWSALEQYGRFDEPSDARLDGLRKNERIRGAGGDGGDAWDLKRMSDDRKPGGGAGGGRVDQWSTPVGAEEVAPSFLQTARQQARSGEGPRFSYTGEGELIEVTDERGKSSPSSSMPGEKTEKRMSGSNYGAGADHGSSAPGSRPHRQLQPRRPLNLAQTRYVLMPHAFVSSCESDLRDTTILRHCFEEDCLWRSMTLVDRDRRQYGPTTEFETPRANSVIAPEDNPCPKVGGIIP